MPKPATRSWQPISLARHQRHDRLRRSRALTRMVRRREAPSRTMRPQSHPAAVLRGRPLRSLFRLGLVADPRTNWVRILAPPKAINNQNPCPSCKARARPDSHLTFYRRCAMISGVIHEYPTSFHELPNERTPLLKNLLNLVMQTS